MRFMYALGALVAGLFLLVTSPSNTVFQGWALLGRALAGQALLVLAVDLVVRASPNRAVAQLIAVGATSLLLLPFATLAFLLSKESGSSWGIAALVLVLWYLGSLVGASIKLIKRATRVTSDK